jgi:hypothetical protein
MSKFGMEYGVQLKPSVNFCGTRTQVLKSRVDIAQGQNIFIYSLFC